MDVKQESRTSSIDPVDQILSSPCFPLDPSLDAELSLHHSMNEAWGNASFTTGKDDLMFTTSFDPTSNARYQSGSASSTPTDLGALPIQSTSTATDSCAPTVRLQRPSFDSSSGIKTTTETGTVSPTSTGGTTTPVDEFGSLNLNLQRRSFSHVGPDAGSPLDGGIADYFGQFLPVASSGGVRASSVPNSPFTQGSSALNLDLDMINPATNRNGYSAPGSPAYLETSPWPGDETPISPISPAPSSPVSSSVLFNGLFDPSTTNPPQPWSGSTPTSHSGASTPFQPMFPVDPFSQFDQTSSLQQQQQQQQQQPHRRSAHNEVEKKYRNNINDRIAELKEAVPALRHARVKRDQAATTTGDDDHDDDDESNEPVIMDGVIIATKLNKATILQKATEYVYHLQHTTQELKQDIDVLLSTIETHTPRGREIASQYRRHVAQRDEMMKQRLMCSEKIKRLKKSDPHHHHHFHLQLKGQDRSAEQHQPFWFPQHQQRGMDGNAF